MKCRHERYASLMYSKFVGGGLIASYSTKEQVRICLECAKWLPLGPSNDDSEQVWVEIRAAELADAVKESHRLGALATFTGLGFDGAEHAGWLEASCDSAKVPEQPGEWSGWLAFAIANHGGE